MTTARVMANSVSSIVGGVRKKTPDDDSRATLSAMDKIIPFLLSLFPSLPSLLSLLLSLPAFGLDLMVKPDQK